jgi:hypothetical protein
MPFLIGQLIKTIESKSTPDLRLLTVKFFTLFFNPKLATLFTLKVFVVIY